MKNLNYPPPPVLYSQLKRNRRAYFFCSFVQFSFSALNISNSNRRKQKPPSKYQNKKSSQPIFEKLKSLILPSKIPPFHHIYNHILPHQFHRHFPSPAMAFSCNTENCNKENINIPPFYPEQRSTPTLLLKSPLLPCKKRRIRKPLEDITHLFNQPVHSVSAPDNRIHPSSSSSSVCKSKCGKRRAEGDVNSSCKKINLVYSSKNFR